MTNEKDISYTQEILRKGIHLLSLAIPIIYSMIDRTTAIMILLPMTLFFIGADVLSHKSGFVRKLILQYFGGMMRAHELRSDKLLLNGASYVVLSALMCVVVFPKVIAITAFTVLIISDICAALFGRKFGKHKFLDKSLEGTLAFIISAMIVVLFIGSQINAPMSFMVSGVIASIIGGIIENISIRLRMDDNFSIPVSIGIVMWLLGSTIFETYQPFLALM